MFELTEYQARLLREFLGSEWRPFISNCIEISDISEDEAEEQAEAIYKALGGTD
ncbi:hypothetical protein [Pantoea sp. BAV 3049]|uniref:hypothetical protein n=1 Tax=Pantoea sp. BAV 3049 TaxID=2654188 RepID=UPI00131B043D|nr:hypothetical protein [Pantoea sp. BAV 3049]